MKKKEWGNEVWLLFKTLAEKIKIDSPPSELMALVSHITSICNNLPCPDCQQHASRVMAQVNKQEITASKTALIDFLWRFHNEVNRRTKTAVYPKEALDKYKTSNTGNVIKQFIQIMNKTSNNQKTMLNGFHRNLYMKKFIEYINGNIQKYN